MREFKGLLSLCAHLLPEARQEAVSSGRAQDGRPFVLLYAPMDCSFGRSEPFTHFRCHNSSMRGLCAYPHFRDEEMSTERLTNLLNGTQLRRGGAGI